MRRIFTNLNNVCRTGKIARFLSVAVCFILFSAAAYAQQRPTVTGRVVDESGVPMSGVTVVVPDTSIGAITDASGQYTIGVPEGAALVFNFMGYNRVEEPVGTRSVIDVVMEPAAEVMKELVVVGYGALERRSITNAVTKVTPDDFVSGVSNPLMALQGKVPGLSISSSNGSDPNADAKIQIRGLNSVMSPQDVLVVVDGVPGADINTVAKEDIESISVLKDASSGAIYGTRGTGGVVIVTTKQPKAGRMTATYSTELSIESMMRTPQVLTADQFREFGRTSNGAWDYGASTDWIKEVTVKNPFSHRHVVSISGATPKVGMTASFNARDAVGTIIDSDRKEVGGRINGFVNFLGDRMKLTTNVSYTEMDMNLPHMEIWGRALRMNPTYPLYASPEHPDDRGETSGYYMLLSRQDVYNPVAESKYRSNQLAKQFLNTSATLRFNIFDTWSVTATAAANRVTEKQTEYRSRNHRIALEQPSGSPDDGWSKHRYATNNNKLLDITTNYVEQFGDHYINAVAGYSFQEFNGTGFEASDGGFLLDGLGAWNLGKGNALTDGKASMKASKDDRNRLIGFFARVNYDYKDRYIVTLSARYEGSSKFANNKWGFFPSVSAGWRISNEQFMQSAGWIDNLMVRASYGQTGNQDIPTSSAFKTYSSGSPSYINGSWLDSYRIGYAMNPYLKWEIKKEWNVGVDFGFFGHRLTGRVDWYDRNVTDLLYDDVPVSMPPNLYEKMVSNIGNMHNAGFEVELSGQVVKSRDWSYNTSLTADFRGEIMLRKAEVMFQKTMHTLPQPASPGNAVRIEPETAIGSFYIFEHAGFDDSGKALIYGGDGQVKPYSARVADSDQKQLGNALPKVVLSWSNQVRYKNFDLSLYFRSWIGHDIFNVQNMYNGVNNGTTLGKNVLIGAYEADGNAHMSPTEGHVMSSYWLEKGTFLKLDNVTLGYNLPKVVKWIDNARVFFTVRNVFVLTGYKGTDPEVNITGLDPGFSDLDSYPMTRTFMLGVSIGF